MQSKNGYFCSREASTCWLSMHHSLQCSCGYLLKGSAKLDDAHCRTTPPSLSRVSTNPRWTRDRRTSRILSWRTDSVEEDPRSRFWHELRYQGESQLRRFSAGSRQQTGCSNSRLQGNEPWTGCRSFTTTLQRRIFSQAERNRKEQIPSKKETRQWFERFRSENRSQRVEETYCNSGQTVIREQNFSACEAAQLWRTNQEEQQLHSRRYSS